MSGPYEGELIYGLILPKAVYEFPLFKRESRVVNGTALMDIYMFMRTSWQGYPASDLYGWYKQAEPEGVVERGNEFGSAPKQPQ